MSSLTEQPWASGPVELLEHGITLLQEDSGTARRLALIAVDNAVELAIKTYLSLPKRVTGLSIPRKRFEEIAESFPALLDALEESAPNTLDGVDLASIEWYHRLRNQLYHQGYGLSVEREKVDIYAELAKVLFKNLFGVAPLVPRGAGTELLGRFIELWPRLENALQLIVSQHSLIGRGPTGVLNAARFLWQADVIPEATFEEIGTLRRLRNDIVHGVADYKGALSPDAVQRLEALVKSFEDVTGGGGV